MVYKIVEMKKNGRMKVHGTSHRIGKASMLRKKLILENMTSEHSFEYLKKNIYLILEE